MSRNVTTMFVETPGSRSWIPEVPWNPGWKTMV